MQYSANKKPLNLELLTELTSFIFTSWFEKSFQNTENIQNLKCEGNWSKLQPKISSFGQS